MYLYETHCHTAEGSLCGEYTAAELVSVYADHGYSGIVITDHFYGGNSAIKGDLSWKQKVERFGGIYETASRAGEKSGLQVFFGWKYSRRGLVLLTYGLGIDWLYVHPEAGTLEPVSYAQLIRESGGILIHAHPFRDRGNGMICLMPNLTDGVEIANKQDLPRECFLAEQYAENFNLMKVGGTDFHKGEHLMCLGGVALPTRVSDVSELFGCIRSGQARII